MAIYRNLVALWLLGLLVITLGLAHQRLVITQHNWSLNDWLISYASGFVRRGLTGEIALALPFPVEWNIFTLIGIATALYFYCVFRLATLAPPNLAHFLLLACPALYFFQITDTDGAFRKEILFYAFYGLLLLQTCQNRPLWPVFILLPAIILSHEALIAFMPMVLLPLALTPPSRKELLAIGFCIALSIIAFIASITIKTTPTQILEICTAIANQETVRTTAAACASDGAVSWLDKGTDFGRKMVALRTPDYLPDLPWLLLLMALPLIASLGIIWRFAIHNKRGIIAFIIGLALTLVLWFPLFFIATDWGRWLSMLLSLLALQIYFMAAKAPATSINWVTIAAAFLFAPLYATSWQLGHWGDILRPGIMTPTIAEFATSP